MGTDLMEWGAGGARRAVAARFVPRTDRAAHRSALSAYLGALVLAILAELQPWMFINVGSRSTVDGSRAGALTDPQLTGQYRLVDLPSGRAFVYWLIWLVLAMLAGVTVVVAAHLRRVAMAATVGVGLVAVVNLVGIADGVGRGDGAFGGMRGLDPVALGVTARPGAGLYCAFAAVGLVLLGTVVSSLRDGRWVAAADPGPVPAAGGATGSVPAAGAATGPAPAGTEPGPVPDPGAGGMPVPGSRGQAGSPGDPHRDQPGSAGPAQHGVDAVDIVVAPTAPFVHPPRKGGTRR